MNIIRRFFTPEFAGEKELATIPAGVFFLSRLPSSPKGVCECIFKDAAIAIRKASVEFQYQLVVSRVFEEGEADLESSGGEDDASELDNEDEWSFLLDESLKLSYLERDGHIVVTWIDVSGDIGDRFEFVCDSGIKPPVFDRFDLTARKSQYERKYNRAFTGKEAALDEFDFDGQLNSNVSRSKLDKQPQPTEPSKPSVPSKSARHASPPSRVTATAENSTHNVQLVEGTTTVTLPVSVHLFDPAANMFVEQEPAADVAIIEIADNKFEFFLDVVTPKRRIIGRYITDDMNECFNYENQVFIFNNFSDKGAFSFLLRFESKTDLDQFRKKFVQAMWERKNRRKYDFKASDWETNYLCTIMNDLNISNEDKLEREEDSEPEEEDISEMSRHDKGHGYDVDEDYEEELSRFESDEKNSQLAVGTANDRSYIVRGSKIGVFAQTGNDDLEFSTTIDGVQTLKGESFVPSNVMLHTSDRALLMRNPDDSSKIFKMDLERGQVVEEWDVGADSKLQTYAPSNKLAQLTDEQTFFGAGRKKIFRVDPRLSGTSKIVENESQQYARNIYFSSLATTAEGQIAAGSESGEIRLYSKLGRAKNMLPALGDAIIGLDSSADGRYLLATCESYLLLIDTETKDGKATGFVKNFDSNFKPLPMRLHISPEHAAFMQNEIGGPIVFTPAHFNIGPNSTEQMIVTSAGPYVITWSLKKALRRQKDPYLIKRYTSNVTADNFKFGTDKKVIVALEDDVNMVSRTTFKKPTTETMSIQKKGKMDSRSRKK